MCLTSLPPDNLVDPLFGDTEGLGDTGSGFTCFIPGDNFGISVDFFRRVIGLQHIGEWRVVQHFEDMKGCQPQVEASCGFEPLWGISVCRP